jgi:hypothetical protein
MSESNERLDAAIVAYVNQCSRLEMERGILESAVENAIGVLEEVCPVLRFYSEAKGRRATEVLDEIREALAMVEKR